MYVCQYVRIKPMIGFVSTIVGDIELKLTLFPKVLFICFKTFKPIIFYLQKESVCLLSLEIYINLSYIVLSHKIHWIIVIYSAYFRMYFITIFDAFNWTVRQFTVILSYKLVLDCCCCATRKNNCSWLFVCLCVCVCVCVCVCHNSP